MPPGVARPPFQSFLETLSPNRRPQTFGPSAGPSQGPGAPCRPASELSALPRGPGPRPHTRHTELEAWLLSQSGSWFHFPCRSSAREGHTEYEACALAVWLPSASPRFGPQLGGLLLSTCSVPGTLPT